MNIWKPDYLKMFICHVARHKKEMAELKDQLAREGISAFVAHEDITTAEFGAPQKCGHSWRIAKPWEGRQIECSVLDSTTCRESYSLAVT